MAFIHLVALTSFLYFQLISELANENTLAFLVQDSDFWIYQYPKHVHLLSAKNFDFTALFKDHKTLTTDCYSRQELADHLDWVAHRLSNPKTRKFEVGHLPLLASFKGNNFIHHEELESFHRKLGGYLFTCGATGASSNIIAIQPPL